MPSGFQSFIRTLPCNDLQLGSYDITIDELTVLFAALHTAKELGLVQEGILGSEVSATPCQSYVIESGRIGEFLIHPEAAVRISALSLLIAAPSTTKPFSSDTLQVLIKNFPYMHTDSDPQYRGEIFSLIRKFIIRLRGSLSSCLKSTSLDDGSQLANQRTAANDLYAVGYSNTAGDHIEFLRWYVGFLELELQPTMSYQRHISALKTLVLLLQTGLDNRIGHVHLSRLGQDQTSWNCSIEIFRPSLFRLLGDLLINPFDDVRATASALLNMFPRTHIRTSLENDREKYIPDGRYSHSRLQLVKALERAERVASGTSRADHADAVARLYHILFDLASSNTTLDSSGSWYELKQTIVERLLSTLEENLYSTDGSFQNAIRETSVHGYISALRYIVSTPEFHSVFPSPETGRPYWRLYHDRLILVCENIWLGVRDILCIDSPEGQDEDAVDELRGPKDLLSCSWRALRESSLDGADTKININSSYAPDTSGSGLVEADLNKIGTLSFTQLAELRHRGAFSAVSQTFTACCQKCAQTKDPSASGLLNIWYKDALAIIDTQASKLTRRSAGLPALVTGIASSQPDGPIFHKIMRDLQEIASLDTPSGAIGSDIKLPRVHALNCLKDIFTNTKLATLTEAYVMPCLMISTECLGSKMWAIRNCGLMLFKALMNRMCRFKAGCSVGLGGNFGSELGSRIIFQKYPSLIELLAQLLQDPIVNESKGSSSQLWELSIKTERVFPALELIGEKVPSFSGDEDKLLKILVFEQFRSPVWGVREHSARIYASLLRHEEILASVCELSAVSHESIPQNQIHGTALCIRYALQRLWVSSSGYWLDNSGTAFSTVREVCKNLFPWAKSHFVQATLVEILNDVVQAGIRCGLETTVLSQINTLLENHGLFDLLSELLSQADTPIPRSSFLLLKAISVSKISIMLAQNLALEDLLVFMNSISALDSDTTCWLLDRIQHTFCSHKRSQVRRIEFYIAMIQGARSQQIQLTMTSNLADDLMLLFEHHTQISDEFASLRQLVVSVDIPEDSDGVSLWNRDLANASLRLRGCCLALSMLSSDAPEFALEFKAKLDKWNQRLRFAISDETEFSTRHAAAVSMKIFFLGLRISSSHSTIKPYLLQTCLVLYGMLIDDDEGIRYLAAQAASILFSLEFNNTNQATALLPLAASSKLADILAEDFIDSTTLCAEAMGRFLGLPINLLVPSIDSTTSLTPVPRLLEKFQTKSTVLFQEEKQNLFVEDVREVETWAKVLTRIILRPGNTHFALQLYSWVSEGISALIDAMGEAGGDGVLGWVSNPDVFILGVRVIRGAKILLLVPPSETLSLDKGWISQGLEILWSQGRKVEMHHCWLSHLRTVIDCDEY
ncbi:HEAT repeat protein [Histoplasma capsulatum var. duboisii H88]|uniref:HEAT repeat protein n=1 Tax=Ajellomyces capsulatus (strain H88) TaxID=544711 RepID=F0UKF4_AJEC8|nr:HEAT repeat protein [Histoplasma capsulatum var. duboisii H88]